MLWSRAETVLAAARRADLTYAEVGATATAPLPDGYRHVHLERVVGHGDGDLAVARQVVLGWHMHRHAGLRVMATAPAAHLRAVVVVGVGAGPVRLLAPCRVVDVVDAGGRAGFAYGTLAGHPESGEERFEVSLRDDGAVVLELTAFSRPATWYSRLGGPVSRSVQDVVTRRYGSAVEGAVRRG